MAFSKITLNGTTLMDVTQDSVMENNLLSGETATKANGVRTVGTLEMPIEYGIPYDGVDLSTKFADEITTAGGDQWAWIKSRITSGDYTGLHLGDYLPITCTNQAATQLQAKIIGVNTYTKYGDSPIGNHIDFFAGYWPTNKQINSANYNNGTASSPFPWLASDAYLYANSKQGSVPTTATVNPTMVVRDYRSDGIYYFLPSSLKNVIVEKRVLLEARYNANSLLTDASAWDWVNIGKIWFPHELEVHGTTHWTKPGRSSAGFVPYPFFRDNMNRLAFGNSTWWLLSPITGSSTGWCYVYSNGTASYSTTGDTSVKAPVCFRVA